MGFSSVFKGLNAIIFMQYTVTVHNIGIRPNIQGSLSFCLVTAVEYLKRYKNRKRNECNLKEGGIYIARQMAE